MKKLFEAKGEIPVIKKDANNPFFKSGYATLSNIIEVTEPILKKHGLMVTHVMQGNSLITQIWDGEKPILESSFLLPTNGDIQKIGSAITYAKRYNITAMLNLNIEDDDDGNAVKGTTPKLPVKKITDLIQPIKPEPISKECQNYINYINNADTLAKLKDVGTALASEPTLTKNDKDHLREIYKQKEKELK